MGTIFILIEMYGCAHIHTHTHTHKRRGPNGMNDSQIIRSHSHKYQNETKPNTKKNRYCFIVLCDKDKQITNEKKNNNGRMLVCQFCTHTHTPKKNNDQPNCNLMNFYLSLSFSLVTLRKQKHRYYPITITPSIVLFYCNMKQKYVNISSSTRLVKDFFVLFLFLFRELN